MDSCTHCCSLSSRRCRPKFGKSGHSAILELLEGSLGFLHQLCGHIDLRLQLAHGVLGSSQLGITVSMLLLSSLEVSCKLLLDCLLRIKVLLSGFDGGLTSRRGRSLFRNSGAKGCDLCIDGFLQFLKHNIIEGAAFFLRLCTA